MPCPFGYKADEEGEVKDVEDDSDGSVDDGECEGGQVQDKGASKKSGSKGNGNPRFDYEKDPVSWFYQHQITSEEEFKARQLTKKEAARRRLDAIMAKKHKRLEYVDEDVQTIASSELSELDSDLHSLGSLISCAASWVEDSEYKTPAESTLQWMLPTAVVVAAFTMFQSYLAIESVDLVHGKVLNEKSPQYAGIVAALLLLTSIVLYMSTSYRSRRLLLGGMVGLTCTYAATAAITAILMFHPTKTEKAPSCPRGVRECSHPVGPAKDLDDMMETLTWCFFAVGTSAVLLGGACSWYIFELCYLEKKAMKHNRRHKKRKHSIPWKKIKVVGPVMNCGANKLAQQAAAAQGGGGGCPMSKGAAAPAGGGGKCPFGAGSR